MFRDAKMLTVSQFPGGRDHAYRLLDHRMAILCCVRLHQLPPYLAT